MYARDARPRGGVLEEGISPKFLLWVLGQWWMYVIPAGLVLAAIAGAAVMYSYVPKYQATALLTIKASEPFVAYSPRARESRSYVPTQLEMMRSEMVLEPVLKLPQIADMPELRGVTDPVAHMVKHLSVRRHSQSDLYSIGYTSPSPQSAAEVVNEIIRGFLSVQSDKEIKQTQRVIDLLDTERRRRESELNGLRNHVVTLVQEITVENPLGNHAALDFDRPFSPLGGLFQSMTEAEVDREVMEAELQSLSAPDLADTSESTGLFALSVQEHEEIRARRHAMNEMDAQMEAIKKDSILHERNPQWETNTSYVQLQAQRALSEEELKAAELRVRDAIVTKAQATKDAAREQQIAKLNLELKLLDARNKLLLERFHEQVKKLQTGDGRSAELGFARAELERANRVYELIESRKLSLQTEQNAPPRVELERLATPPLLPVEPIPFKRLFLVCSAAFAAPLGLAFLREITVRRISDIEQLAQYTGLRVLGEVAALPVRFVAVSPNKVSNRLRRDTFIYAESINSLRTNLALAEGLKRQVLAVTSASAGEGKTSVAVSLAMSIANATEQPTLVIDGDMRSPFAATMLRAQSLPGLFEVLTNACTLDDAIQRVGDNGLYIIPGGRATKSTHRVLKIDDVNQLLEQLRTRFSTIVIDTPPILGASEALVLAKAADAVLFCSLCGVSKAAQVRLAIDRLQHARVNVAGAVLSGTSVKRYQCVYGYYANGIEADDLSGASTNAVVD